MRGTRPGIKLPDPERRHPAAVVGRGLSSLPSRPLVTLRQLTWEPRTLQHTQTTLPLNTPLQALVRGFPSLFGNLSSNA